MATDLLMSLMNMDAGVAVPQGQPIQQGQNPLTSLQGMPAGTIPAATPAPQLTANPVPNQVRSLEEMLFGVGGYK